MWKGHSVADSDIHELVTDHGVCYTFKNTGLDGFVTSPGNYTMLAGISGLQRVIVYINQTTSLHNVAIILLPLIDEFYLFIETHEKTSF